MISKEKKAAIIAAYGRKKEIHVLRKYRSLFSQLELLSSQSI